MAALTVTEKTERLPLGNLWQRTVRVTTTADAADEWISSEELGMTEIIAVVGTVIHGITAVNGVSVELNARGTGVAEDVNMGDLGIETEEIADVSVTVLGRG